VKPSSLASTTMTSAGGNVCWASDESAFRTRSGRFLVGMTTLISTTQFLVLRGCTAVVDSTFNASRARDASVRREGFLQQDDGCRGTTAGCSGTHLNGLARKKSTTKQDRDVMDKPVQSQPAAFRSPGRKLRRGVHRVGPRVVSCAPWSGERFTACFAPGSSLLELGCGTG
jgi:hypothetical protein